MNPITSKNAIVGFLILIATILAGCSGAAGGLEIAAHDGEINSFGNLEITVTVENTDDSRSEADLYCKATVSGRVFDKTQTISVSADSRQTYEMTIDIPVSDFGEGGKYECKLK